MNWNVPKNELQDPKRMHELFLILRFLFLHVFVFDPSRNIAQLENELKHLNYEIRSKQTLFTKVIVFFFV